MAQVIDYTQPQPDAFLTTDYEIVKDYAQYSGEDAFDIVDKMANHKEIVAPEFFALQDTFYSQSKNYIYDILSGNPNAGVRANLLNKFIPNCVAHIKNHKGKEFLDFGGGVGAVCEIAYNLGKSVTYMDLKTHYSDFAIWRFNKYNWPISVHIINEDTFELQDEYDIIFTDAVWEHLPSDKQISYIDKLCSHINKDGLFIFLVDLSGNTQNMPFHFNVDIQKVHEQIQHNSMINLYGVNNFASLWMKV